MLSNSHHLIERFIVVHLHESAASVLNYLALAVFLAAAGSVKLDFGHHSKLTEVFNKHIRCCLTWYASNEDTVLFAVL